MKIYKHRISAATNSVQGSGTAYYLVTFDQIQKFFNSEDSNVWIGKAFEELGWDAIYFDNNLFGSQIIGDDLYICVTDGKDIEVNGDLVNPEEVLIFIHLMNFQNILNLVLMGSFKSILRNMKL